MITKRVAEYESFHRNKEIFSENIGSRSTKFNKRYMLEQRFSIHFEARIPS